jgi:tetraacyldisaccharide 4'-kinase
MKINKPSFWDFKKPNILAKILLPFTIPIIINNLLPKKKIYKKNIKTVCVGNIYLGGTGKTPLVIKVYQILKQLNFKTATIKKFYKDHFDEQKILNENTKLYCQKDRGLALDQAIRDNKNVVIFDDGLQDRSIDYDLKFVCFNNIKWIGNSFLIPAGPLREKIASISKYNAIFINGNGLDNINLKNLIKKYSKDIKIFESFYQPINFDQFDIDEKYLIFSGIGNPEVFKETLLRNKLDIIKEIIFPDHYNYTQADIDKIKIQAKGLNAKIITTEKDYIKINSNKNDDIKFLKVELKIVNEEELTNYLKLHLCNQ